MEDFSRLEEKLNIEFKNKDLLNRAFCHRSYLNENPNFSSEHNERLEFLGDAVLELIVTEYLYKNYDNAEGDLTSWRAALVNTKNLAKIANRLGFENFILLSKGEAKDNGRARQFILANTFEAFLGALYLDQGYNQCQKFIAKYLLIDLAEIIEQGIWRDAKSHFQEIAQDKEKVTPSYKLLEQSGPDHARRFVCGVFLKEKLIAKGEGLSKHEAEEDAAKKGLEIKNWN